MAVLWVEGCALLVAMPLFGVVPEARSVFVLPLVLLVLLFLGALVAATYVLPSVALGHWLGGRRGSGRRWWWVMTGAALGLVPAIGLALLVVAFSGESPVFSSWQDIRDWLLYAAALYSISVPAALAAHRTVLHADAGHPVRSAGHIIGYGALLLLTELVVVLMVVKLYG
ncbi:hypothetical protein ABZX40_39965 [Streptomyces sp. NPDC004610]|uniref:hypothetical protein n=1 Tax=unclassified Streptomyces TaxID=2593676 RepID=UPI0033B368FA